jgi:dihydrodipicolinate synthase/N-acetylneuraminate lyase
MVALSDPGEASMISDVEAKEVLTTAIGAADKTKVMVAGVSRDSVRGTLGLVDVAAGLGYDAVLVKRPAVIAAGAVRETLTYFRTVADRAEAPIVLYSTRLAPLAVEIVAELAGHPRVIGMVDEVVEAARGRAIVEAMVEVRREVAVTAVFAAVTGRMLAPIEEPASATFVSADSLAGRTAVAVAPQRAAIKTRTKVVGFQYLAAKSNAMLEGLAAGASGVMPAFSAAAPQACYEVYAAWKDGDLRLAEEKQQRFSAAVGRIEETMGTPGIRYGCDLNGYFGGMPRLPLLPLTGAERQEVEQLMSGMRS